MTNFELYELLKEKLGEEAARTLAEMPQVQDLATKEDLDRHHLATQADLERLRAEVRGEIEGFRTEVHGEIETFRTEVRAEFERHGERIEGVVRELKLFVSEQVKSTEASMLRWMLTLFIPVWLGVAGMVVAILLKL